MHFYDPPPKCLKMFILIILGALWPWQKLRGYGRKVHAKFWPSGMPWDPIYDNFESHVHPHISNIGYMKVYNGLQALGGISFLFLMKFHVECRQNHVWGPPGA